MVKEIDNQRVQLKLQVKTNAPKNDLEYWEDALDIKIKASPVKGEANKAIIEYLAELLNINTSQFNIQRGLTSSTKIIDVFGISKSEVEKKLSKYQPTRRMQ